MDLVLSIPTQTGDLPARLTTSPVGPLRGVVIVADDANGGDIEAQVAGRLNRASFATLLTAGLTANQHRSMLHTAEACADIALRAARLAAASDWVANYPDLREVRIGYFGTNMAAAAALWATAERPAVIAAVVAWNARPLLAAPALVGVRAPTLFITGTHRASLLSVNRAGFERLRCEKRLEFLTTTDVGRIAELAQAWFERNLADPYKSAA